MRRATPDELARSLLQSQESPGSYRPLVTAVAAVAWLVVLGYSALMVHPAVSGRERRVLFFPEVPHQGTEHTAVVLRDEVRYVPYRSRADAALRMLVEETILGPADHRTHRLLPREVEIISTHVTGEVAYVNLSHHAWLAATPVPSTGDERIQALHDTIRFNFPRLRDVRILIEGQEPRREPAPTGGATDG